MKENSLKNYFHIILLLIICFIFIITITIASVCNNSFAAGMNESEIRIKAAELYYTIQDNQYQKALKQINDTLPEVQNTKYEDDFKKLKGMVYIDLWNQTQEIDYIIKAKNVFIKWFDEFSSQEIDSDLKTEITIYTVNIKVAGQLKRNIHAFVIFNSQRPMSHISNAIANMLDLLEEDTEAIKWYKKVYDLEPETSRGIKAIGRANYLENN